MPTFNLEAGMLVVLAWFVFALRTRVNMSAIGSVIMIGCLLRLARYQEALRMPGISPAWARSRRQMRQIPNLR